MRKESALYQLMGVRMNGVMNGITNSDGEYQEIIRKSDVYSGRLEEPELPLLQYVLSFYCCKQPLQKNRPTCGNKYCIDRSTNMSFKLIDCTHRHLVFTIDEDLRPFFLNDRSLLDCLFQAVRSVILRLFQQINKSKNFVPGFICVLHTFGRPLEWNPHIHCLLTEGGFSDDGFWRVVKHFNYTYLRKAFQTALLNELESHIGPSFKKTKAAIYKKDKNGFYVYAKPNLCDTDSVVKYISRYLGRPVIATSRIGFHFPPHPAYPRKTFQDDTLLRALCKAPGIG